MLPPGYEVVALTVPSQILTEQDGRIAISFCTREPARRRSKCGQSRTRRQAGGITEAVDRGSAAGNRRFRERPSRNGCRSAHIRTATSSTSCSSRRRMHSACITTTRNRAPGVNGYANVVRTGSVGESSFRQRSGYGRAVAGARNERRRDDRVQDQRRRSGGCRRARRRHSVRAGARRADDAAAHCGDLHGARELPSGRR